MPDAMKRVRNIFKYYMSCMNYKISNKKNPYTLFNSFFENVEEGSLIVRCPEFLGSFEMDARSHILKRILFSKHYEPQLISVIYKYIDLNGDVIDIGANIGLFSILFSKIISKNNSVLAIEPTPLALRYLYNNIKRNNSEKSIIVFEGVAADTNGSFKLRTIPGNEEYSSLRDIVHPSVINASTNTILVKGNTIDNLVEKYNLKPKFIKIDVEGAEYFVLRGAKNTLKILKPIIISEISEKLLASFGKTSGDVLDILKENGYKIYDAYDLRITINDTFDGEIVAIPS